MAGADRPIRVVRVIARLNVGGPALHVSYLSRELDRIGYETTLVAGSVAGSEGSMEYVADELGVDPVYVPELQREISPLADAVAARRVLRIIRDVRPDVLHTHTAKAGAVGRIAALLAGPARPKAVVHTFHGHVLRGYFSPAKTEAFRRLERGLAKSTDALVAVSPEVRDDLVSLGVAPADRITVVRLGLDFSSRLAAAPDARESLRRELGIDPDAFVVAWLGRMTEIKRADDLLRAFAALRRRRDNAELLVVGGGPLRQSLEDLARDLGIAGHAHFTGFRSGVGDVYAAADAVALSSANEGTPVSVIEAQAAGLPVVSTDVGGVRDVVVDGESGFIVVGGDVEALADRLDRLGADPELRTRFGHVGAERARSRYSVPRLVDDMDRLYRELLAQPDRRTRGLSTRSTAPPATTRAPSLRRRLRVVLVSQYFPPEVGATQSRMQSFADHLAEQGHRVTVIAEFPNHPQGVMPPEYRGRLIEDDRSNPYRVLRVWVRTSAEKTQMTRLSFYVSFMTLATAVAPLAGRADVVVATTPPLFTGIAGLAIARMNGAPLVLDVRDLWPAAATSLMQISPGWETTVAESIERILYRSAAVVTAVTKPFCEHIDAIRAHGPRTALLPNGTIPQFFVDDDNGARRALGVPRERFLVTFAGMLGIAQALPAAVEAAALLDGAAELMFVGDGPMKAPLVAAADDLGLRNVRFEPQLPLEQIPPLLAASDALLVPLSGHPTFTQFVPSKLIDFMAVGKPIVLSAAGEAARILERARAGVVVPPEAPAELADAIRWLASHRDEAAAMGERGRQFAERRLRSTQAERLEQLLYDAVGEPPTGG